MRILRAIFALAMVSAFAGILPSPASEMNELSTGPAAKARDIVDITVNPVVDFNYKTRDEVYAMRTREVMKYPLLLNGQYEPRASVFSAIEDGKPWWGTAGSAVWGSGMRSIEGPSEEARFVMNPYLLVGCNPGNLYIWNPSAITQADVKNPEFPYFWKPASIKFSPKSGVATAVYNISKYQEDILKTGKLKANVFIKQFSLVAYNARDFGYNYIWLDQRRSTNIINDNNVRYATPIRQFIHCGGTCGYPGNCNNMSPFMKEIDRCRFTELPARAVVCLWKEEPEDTGHKPDMYFLIEFR